MEEANDYLSFVIRNIEKIERVYHLLSDDYSKSLFLELLKFKTLNNRHVKLPLNNKLYWRKYHKDDRDHLKERNTIDTGRWFLSNYEIDGEGGVINLHGYILTTFILEQYAYQKKTKIIRVNPGDFVIDGGACWGDTSLYFADKVGTKGKVYAFEFVKDNITILKKNIDLNKHLKNRIEIVENALWNISGETVAFSPRGPSTWLGVVNKNIIPQQASTLTIDDLVEEKVIPKIDFIKMDIEGSELQALIGSKKTIQEFKPKLAISIYHKIDDFIEIPLFIDNLALGYNFFIDHYTIHSEETILFAESKM
jgi:FkbM family methyltransferase